MNPGDILVCGVFEDILVEDILVSVPKGHAVLIPGDKAVDSKDLWRLISQKTLFRLQGNTLLQRKAQPNEPEADMNVFLQSQLSALTDTVSKLEAELAEARKDTVRKSELEAEVARLVAENSKLTKERESGQNLDEKLESILKAVKDRPTTVTVTETARVKAAVVDDSAPIYIPSRIKGETTESRVTIQESTSDGSSLAGASKALQGIKRRGQ